MKILVIIPLTTAVFIAVAELFSGIAYRFSHKKNYWQDFPLKERIKAILVEWLLFSMVSGLTSFYFMSLMYFDLTEALLLLLVALGVALVPSYQFIVQPVIHILFTKYFKKTPFWEAWLEEQTHERGFMVRIIDKEVTNAFATGVVPFFRFILLGKSMVEKMSDQSVKALLMHELGHIKKKHLLMAYLVNVFCTILFTFSLHYLITNFREYEIVIVVLSAVGWSTLTFVLSSLAQRQMEYQADAFAAEKVGVENYVAALIELDQVTDGGVSKKNLAYPTLSQRIAHVRGMAKAAMG